LAESLKSLKDLQNWIRSLYEDPIAKILINNSFLTKTQLETLLIDIISEYLTENRIKSEKKAELRLKGKISKGAFHRTLKQAKRNVIRSIYTLILLEYLGLMSYSTLQKYLELSEKIKTYLEMLRSPEKAKIEELRTLKEEIEDFLKALSSPKMLKGMM